MTRAQLAEAVGVYGLKLIADWENGRKYPRKGAAALEEVLGVRLPGPRCGRPEGHRGPCRALDAVTRYYRASVDRERRRAAQEAA